ncbi:PAS domain-containing protein [Rhodopseudomonas sp. HC1]|uniref:PAS domain-containing protein n=1 Tax=Rhodopseudomonas infernalis TaxID=2897386 RepID=UPI001EE7F739|nr:PAS domain-containing protein [Rhodopseudomonas infernalis]MCG6206633.1 PAS domain-containing protein [Rhodopseudomonas infernalis]
MQRFVCEQNIAHFDRLLESAADETLRRTLLKLLALNKRELALLNSQLSGADLLPIAARRRSGDHEGGLTRLWSNFDTSVDPYMLIDSGPGLKIIAINEAYGRATYTNHREVAGKPLFDVLPDNPAIETADGVSNLYNSLRAVAETGQPHALPVQRYDVRDGSAAFIERYWLMINTPLHAADGKLICLLNHIEDITAEVLAN